MDRLVGSVLDREEVHLALALRDGGTHVVRRAIELAGVLIDAEPTSDLTPVERRYEVGSDGRVIVEPNPEEDDLVSPTATTPSRPRPTDRPRQGGN